ncbi:MAG: 3-oxoacyl-ACP reductase family protein [Nostoc sp.]|uniref:SDR family NAD(P)-dependent oxidoreductase n=1 Tax=Nostoc sp. TaxID=1180 RepID=UPI002FF58B5F
MKKLEGKVAIVTGSSRGIGKEIAIKLAQEGAKVVVNYSRSPEKAEEVVNQIKQQGGEATAIQADMNQVDQIQQLVTSSVEKYGQLDILVSNAGIEHFGKLEEITPQDFERVFSVNVAGQLFVTQAAARYLSSGGRIVLTSSVSARFAAFYHTLYAASKAAVSAMVLNLAPELGERGITINAIAPGGTVTDMAQENAERYTHPALQNVSPDALLKSQIILQRLAQPEEIAAAVAFLVSDDASYITGSTLAVDGGML